MRKGNTMKVSASFLVLLMGFSLVACGNSNPAAQPPVNNMDEQSPAPEQQPNESAAIEAEGILTGWADPHTVEIRVNEKPMSFQVSEDLQKSLDDIDDEDSVRFKYVEKTIDATTKQLVLTEIAKMESSDDNNGSDAGGKVTSDRPKTAELEVTVEGMTEKRPVTLAQAKGYSLYVFEPMAFDAEDHELTMKIDPDYEVEIEKLSADYNLDVLKMNAKEELSETGEVKQLTAEQLSNNGPMKDAKLYMMSQNDKKTEYFIVKELDGNGFVFHIHAPIGEPSEGFLPMAYASLNSIMNE